MRLRSAISLFVLSTMVFLAQGLMGDDLKAAPSKAKASKVNQGKTVRAGIRMINPHPSKIAIVTNTMPTLSLFSQTAAHPKPTFRQAAAPRARTM